MKFQEEAIHRTKRLRKLSDLKSVLDRPGSSVTKLNKTPKQRMGRKKNGWINETETKEMRHKINEMKTSSSWVSLRPPHTLAWLWSLSVLTGETFTHSFVPSVVISNLSSCYDSSVKKDMPSAQQRFASLLWNTSFSLGCDILYVFWVCCWRQATEPRSLYISRCYTVFNDT